MVKLFNQKVLENILEKPKYKNMLMEAWRDNMLNKRRNKYKTHKDELVLYGLLREDINLNGGQYLSYVSSCIFEKMFRKPEIKSWINTSANIVYLYADGYKSLCNAMKFAGINKIPFTPIYRPVYQQQTKSKSMIGLFIGPVKRSKVVNLTKRLQLF